MKTLLLLLLSAVSVKASVLECKSLINSDMVGGATVATVLKNKELITKDEKVVSYVTETAPEMFSVEVYIPSLDLRIYGEGPIHLNESLNATAWARDLLVDVVCKKIK